MMKYACPMITLILFIMGCGGGGDDTGSTADTNDTSNSTVTAPETSTQPPITDVMPLRYMNELVVPENFDYNPVEGHVFDIDISSYSTNRAYVSIYGQFEQNADGSYTPVYNSKLTAGSLNNGVAKLDFCIKESQASLLAEVWFYDGSSPLQKTLNGNQSSWIY